MRYASHETISNPSSATALTPAAGAQAAWIFVEQGNIRILGYGTDPTSSLGRLLYAGDDVMWRVKPLGSAKVIAESGSPEVLVIYLK